MSNWWLLLLLPAGGAVGALIVAPLIIRSADWLVDHQPGWYRWWMDLMTGERRRR